MKYVPKHFGREYLCVLVLQDFLCALVSRHVCASTCAQLRRNIECGIAVKNCSVVQKEILWLTLVSVLKVMLFYVPFLPLCFSIVN